jgi:hypothetical protein
VIACRDINIGEEIVAKYGCMYWKNRGLLNDDSVNSTMKIMEEIYKMNRKQKQVLVNIGEISATFLE